jgi:predicted protein tyrosine phosphatase
VTGATTKPSPPERKAQKARKIHHALFICSRNRLRSPTAEAIFAKLPGIECASAGTDDAADVALDPELIAWADVLYVMEAAHRSKINSKFKRHLAQKRIVVLGIPDDYDYMESGLIAILEKKLMPLLAPHVWRVEL